MKCRYFVRMPHAFYTRYRPMGVHVKTKNSDCALACRRSNDKIGHACPIASSSATAHAAATNSDVRRSTFSQLNPCGLINERVRESIRHPVNSVAYITGERLNETCSCTPRRDYLKPQLVELRRIMNK